MQSRKHRGSEPDCRCIGLGPGRSPGLGPTAWIYSLIQFRRRRLSDGMTLVLKSQVGLLVSGLGFAAGALALFALRWEHRPRGQMKIEHDVRYQRIGEGLPAFPALQKPFRHRLKILRFSTKAHATENSRSKIYSVLSHAVSSCCYPV
jgi:hypothetical protein